MFFSFSNFSIFRCFVMKSLIAWVFMCECISVSNSYVLIIHFYIVFECGRLWISRGLFLTIIEHSVWICHSSVKDRKCVRFGSEYRSAGGHKITSFFSRTTAIESKDADELASEEHIFENPMQSKPTQPKSFQPEKSISNAKKRKASVKVNVDTWRESDKSQISAVLNTDSLISNITLVLLGGG